MALGLLKKKEEERRRRMANRDFLSWCLCTIAPVAWVKSSLVHPYIAMLYAHSSGNQPLNTIVVFMEQLAHPYL